MVDAHLELVMPPATEPLEVAFVRDDHLRSPNGSVEDTYLAQLIRVARQEAERVTLRALIDQTWTWRCDYGFPWEIVLPFPPLIEVTEIKYLDDLGVEQTLAPAAYQVSNPSGPRARRARIRPIYGTTWPTTQAVMDAVKVTFRAGYLDTTVSPQDANVPEEILQGMLLMIGELYKQRSESVHALGNSPATIRARNLWIGYRVY